MRKTAFLIFTSIVFVGACSNPETPRENNISENNTIDVGKDTIVSNDNNSAQFVKLKLAEMTFEDYMSLTSNQEVIDFFGLEQIEEGSAHYEEGTVEYKHTIATNPATTSQVKYVWNEKGNLNWIEVRYKKMNKKREVTGIQMLRSDCGIHLGMKLKDLASWNNADVSFYGFGWDVGGKVIPEKTSKLSKCPVEIWLGIDTKGGAAINSELTGDKVLTSSNKTVMQSKIYISHFKYFPKQ